MQDIATAGLDFHVSLKKNFKNMKCKKYFLDFISFLNRQQVVLKTRSGYIQHTRFMSKNVTPWQ